MNVLKRRALLLILLVIALFGLTMLGASAATDTPQGVLEKDPDTTYVASATVTNTADPGVYYYTDLAAAIADADADTTVNVLANCELATNVAIDKNLTIAGAEGITVTNTVASGYLFTVSNDAVVAFGNITFNTNGGFLTASGNSGSVTLGSGTVVTGVAGNMDFFNVSTAYTNGTITMAEGSKLVITGYSGTASVFYTKAAVGKLNLMGSIEIGTSESPVALTTAPNGFFYIAAALPTIDFGGTFNCYTTGYGIKVMHLPGTATRTITLSGTINSVVTEPNEEKRLQLFEDYRSATCINNFIIDGANITMTFGGKCDTYTSIFYMIGTGGNTIEMTSGSLVANSDTGKGFPLIYSDVNTFTMTVSGNSSLTNNGDTASSYTKLMGSKGTLRFVVTADGTPTATGKDAATAPKLYYATDALAVENGCVARINNVALGGTGTYKDAMTGYYTTLAAAVAAAADGDTITILTNQSVSETITLSGKAITLTTASGVTVTNTSETFFISLADNSTLNLSDFNYKGNLFARFDNASGKTATVTLKSGAAIEGGDPTATVATAWPDGTNSQPIFYRYNALGAMAITVEAGASVIRPDTYTFSGTTATISSQIFYFKGGSGSLVLNISGSVKNVPTIEEGAKVGGYDVNANLLYSNLPGNGTTINVYSGAVVEATCNSDQHSRNYQGVFYLAGNGNNTATVNLLGGTVTSHGANPFIYFNAKYSTLNISGDTKFSMPDATQGIARYATASGNNLSIDLSGGATVTMNCALYKVANRPATKFDSDASALTFGYYARLGAEATATYYETLTEALDAAADGDIVTLLTDTTISSQIKVTGKAVTIQGATAATKITATASAFQPMSGASVTVKDVTISAAVANVFYVATDNNTVKLDNVTVDYTAAANSNFIGIGGGKNLTVEIANTTFTSTNSVRVIYVGAATVSSLNVTSTSLTNAVLLRVESSSGVVGSTENPAVLTDLTSNKPVLYAYTAKIYANIFGGTFTGQFLYGGDNNNNTLDVKFNPTGDKTTTFTLDTTGGYYGFAYQNPKDATKNNIEFSFRNTTITESGSASCLLYIGGNSCANLTISVDNSTFTKPLTNSSTAKIIFATDAQAKAAGYAVRIGAEGVGAYYTTVPAAIAAAASGDTVTLFADASLGTATTVSKNVTVTAISGVTFTINKQITINDGGALTLSSLNFKWTTGNPLLINGGGTLTITGTQAAPTTASGTSVHFIHPQPAADTTATVNITGYVEITANYKIINTYQNKVLGTFNLNIEGAAGTKSVVLNGTSSSAINLQGGEASKFNYSIKNAEINATTCFYVSSANQTDADAIQIAMENTDLSCETVLSFTSSNYGALTLDVTDCSITTSSAFSGAITNNSDVDITLDNTALDLASGLGGVVSVIKCYEADDNAAIANGYVARITKDGKACYYPNFADALTAAADGDTICVIKDLAIAPATTIYGKTVTIEGANSDITITKVGEINGDSTYNKVDDYIFNLGSGANVTFKNIKLLSARILRITGNESGKTVVITLDEGALFEATPSRSLWAYESEGKIKYYDAALIFKDSSNIDVTINVKAGATMLVPATETINNPLISINAAATTTLNVWGTMKNLATVAEGSNAQVYVVKGTSNNATLNVYDGAVIEGASNSLAYEKNGEKGDYSGIIYYSAGTENAINIYGGTITTKGVSSVAYTGKKCAINISGNAVINHVDGTCSMFFGTSQTANITGTDDVKPTFNVAKKLLNSGTAYAVNAFTDEGYKTTAKTLGFVVLLDSSKTACTAWEPTIRAKMALEETVYLLNDLTSAYSFCEITTSLSNMKLTITSYGDAKYTWTTSLSAASVFLRVCYNTHLIIDNVIMNAGCRFLRFESDGEDGGFMKVDIKSGAEIYALPNTDGNFIYYGTTRVLTMNIEEGAIIQRKGDSSYKTGNLINLNGTFAPGSVINIKGKISDITNYTGTATRGGNFFSAASGDNARNLVINIYSTAVFEMGQTTTTGTINVTPFSVPCKIYFKDFAAGTDLDAVAKSYGAEVRLAATATADTPYVQDLFNGLNQITDGGSGTLYVFANTTAPSSSTIANKTIHIESVGNTAFTVTASANRLFTLTNGAKLTISNLKINSTTTTNTQAKAGTLLAFVDEEATAKSTVTLNNVELTASGLPFLFTGKSVADVNIVGGSYNGAGMFAFGIASGDLDNDSDVYFQGQVNLTVTGTANAPVSLKNPSTNNDTRSGIFVNTPAADATPNTVKVKFDYVDLYSYQYGIYLRNSAMLTLDFTNGSLESRLPLFSGQGSTTLFADFTEVEFNYTGTDWLTRTYGKAGKGAYLNFTNCVFNATKTTKPFGVSTDVDVTLTGCTINAPEATNVFGSNANNAALFYVAENCTFNIPTTATISTNAYNVLVKGTTTVNGAALTCATAPNYGLCVSIGRDTTTFTTTFNTIAITEAVATNQSIVILANVAPASLLPTLTDQSVTIEGYTADATITNTSTAYFVALGSNSTLNVSNLTYKGNFFATFTAASGKTATLVLKSGAKIEGGDPTVTDGTIFYGACAGVMTLTIEKGASVIRPASYTLPTEIVTSNNIFNFKGGSGSLTLNVSGTVQNLTTIPDDAYSVNSGKQYAGGNAVLLYSNLAGGTTINVYEGGLLEGTSNSSMHSRNYQGVLYLAPNGSNVFKLNIAGGSVISHGANPFAYINTKVSYVTVSGKASISMSDATQGLFRYDTSATTTRDITVDVSQSPTISVKSSTYKAGLAPNFTTDDTAVAMGYPVRLTATASGAPGTNYFETLTAALTAAPADNGNGGATTVYVVGNAKQTNNGSDSAKFTKKVHITSANGGPHTITSSGTINYYTGGGAEMTFTNIIFKVGTRLARIDGDTKMTFGEGAVFESNAGIFIYSNFNADAECNITIDFQKGSKIIAKTAFSNGLVYWDAPDDVAEFTVKFAGEIELAGSSVLVKDTKNTANTNVEFDASSAKITGGAKPYFVNAWLTIKGLEGDAAHAKAAELGSCFLYGTKYADSITQAMKAIADEGTIYLSGNGTLAATTVITDKKVTLESVGTTPFTLTTTASPAFQLGDNAHLVFKNINVIAKTSFIYTDGATTTAYTKIDLESGAKIDIRNYGGAYFLRSASTGILTVNVKNGSSIKLLSDGTVINAAVQGLFDFATSGNAAAEGSAIHVDGQIIYGLKFKGEEAGKSRSAMFKMADKTVDLYFTANADVQLLHTNAIGGTWNAIVCIDGANANTVVSFEGGKYTMAAECGLIGLNGTGFSGTYTVKDAVIAGDTQFLVVDYAAEGKQNTTVITFENVNLGTRRVGKDNRLGYAKLINVAFDSDAIASLNNVVRVEGLANYYTLPEAIEAVPEGGTANIYVFAPTTFYTMAQIFNRHITIVGNGSVLGDSYDLTYAYSEKYGFQIQNVGTLTFKDITVRATSRPLIQYCAVDKASVAQADRDIVINFTNATVNVRGSSVFINSGGHHGDVANKICDSITVNVDKNSTINYTSTSNEDVKFISFNHNTHPYTYANIDGKVTFTSGASSVTGFTFVYSNNPSLTHLTVSETAKLSMSFPTSCESAYLVICTTGSTANNKISLAAEAITDENGALTLGGAKIYTASRASIVPQLYVTASSTIATEALQAWTAKEAGEVVTPIALYLDTHDGVYRYASAFNATVRNWVTDATEATLYLLRDISSGYNFTATCLTNTKLTITSYGDAKYAWTPTFTGASVFFYIANNTHLIIDNVIMNVNSRFMRFESDGETGGYMKVDFLSGAEIYALPGGDGNFMYYSADRVLTMNIEEGAIIQRKGDSSGATGHLINLGNYFAPGSVINVKGELSDITNYTGTGTRNGNLFNVPDSDVTVNIYPTAELEMGQTKTGGKINVTRFSVSGLIYFKDYGASVDLDEVARSYGVGIRLTDTKNMKTPYAQSFARAINAYPTLDSLTLYLIGTVNVGSEVVIHDRNITLIGLDIDGEYHLKTSAAFTIYSKGSITFQNVNIYATKKLVAYNANKKVPGAQADKDVVINFINTNVVAKGDLTELIGSMNHYTTDKDGCGEQASGVTVNIDKDSSIDFTTSSTSHIFFISFNHNSHKYVYANIDGQVKVNVTGKTTGNAFYFVRSNNPGTTQINISETAKVNITLHESRVTSGNSYITSCTGGNTSSNKLTMHMNAISDENGLTLGGVRLYAGHTASCIFEVHIIAKDASKQNLITAWETTAPASNLHKPIAFLAVNKDDGTYHYTNTPTVAFNNVSDKGTVEVLQSVTMSGATLHNKEVWLKGADGIVISNTGTTPFITLTGNATLNVENLKYVGNRFVCFNNGADTRATLNLLDGAYIEGGDPNGEAQYQIIYSGGISGHIVVNVGTKEHPNATVIRPSTYTLDGVNYTGSKLLNFASAASVTVNVYGKLLNQTTLPDGVDCNSQIYYSAGTNTRADFNVFEGAEIEGAAWVTTYKGQYSGLIYFSEQGNITITGGKITAYGPNPLNYTGYNSNNQIGGGFVKISGNTEIIMPDLAYGMIYLQKAGDKVEISGANVKLDINNMPLYHASTTPFITATGTFTSDEAAAAVGLGALIGKNVYTNNISVEDIKDATEIKLLNNPNKGLNNVVYICNELIIDGKSLTITSAKIGEGGVILANSPLTTIARLFTLKNGATLTIDGVSLKNTASTIDRQVETAGTIIAIDEYAVNGVLPEKITVKLTNVTVNAPNSIPFYFGGDSVIELNIVGGSYTAGGMFAIGYYAKESDDGAGDSVDIPVNVTLNMTVTGTADQHVVFKKTKGGDQNAIFFINSKTDPYKPSMSPAALTNKDDICIKLTHVDLEATGGNNIYMRSNSAITLEHNCGTIKGGAWLIASQGSGAWYANFTDVDFIGTNTSYVIRPYGASGSNSYINFNGGSFTANSVKNTFTLSDGTKIPGYVLNFNEDIAVTFNGTVFNSSTGATLFATDANKSGKLSITATDCEFNVAGSILHPTKPAPMSCNGIYVADDATALTMGLYFRATVNGKTKYFNSIAGAVTYADNGSVIYILGNSVEGASDIKFDKFLMFESVGAPEGEKFTITHTGTGNLFYISTGLENDPVRFVMSNIKFISTTASGSIFAVGGNAYAEILLTNCDINTTKGGLVLTEGNGVARVDINDGEFLANHPFSITEQSAIKLNVYNTATITSNGGGNAGTIIYISNNRGEDGATVINLKDVEMYNTTSSGHGIYAMGVSKVDLNMENVIMKVKNWCLSSQSSTHWKVNLTNVDFTSTGNTATRLYGAAGSYINIMGGKFRSEVGASSYNSNNGYAVANFGNSLTVNFYDGDISSDKAPCISGMTSTVTFNIYGGNFNYTGTTEGVSPIAIPSACAINIYGGTFSSVSRTAPVFSNVAKTTNTLTLNSYHAYGNANLITNLGLGTTSANHTGYGQSSFNTIVTTRGATPVLLENVAGLGFRATLDAATYNYLKGLASEQQLRYGMLIIPTDKLPENVAFTHYGLAHSNLTLGEDYFDVEASKDDIQILDDGSVVITIAYTDIADYDTAYSVVFYANMDNDFLLGFDEAGAPIYQKNNMYHYSAYDKSENSRSLSQVARAAYNDKTQSYTEAELAILATLCNGDTAMKELDIFLVVGGSNAAGNTVYNDTFADSFDQSSVSSNVFYSGLITEYAPQTYGEQILHFTATKYTAAGTVPTLGLGWNNDTMGVEIGMAQKLSEYYNNTTGKYAAIMKYAVNNSTLVGENAEMGNWSNELYADFIQMISEQIADYKAQGYQVNVVGMYWMQGEDDVAYVNEYEAAFSALVSGVRTDLSAITGADLSAMPVVVGEIANFLGLTTSQKHSDFIAVQNSFAPKYNEAGELIAGIAGVIVDATSKYVADANGIFITPAELNATGERVIAAMLTNGDNALDSEIVDDIVVPEIENATEILLPDGNPALDIYGNPLGFTSIVMAAAKAPAGSTIKLSADQTVFTQMDLLNLDGITLDGNGATIVVNADNSGLNLQNSNVTLKNFKFVYSGNGVAIKIDATSSLVIDGDSYIEASSTAIELAGTSAKLEIKGGTFKTTDDEANDAIIRTSSAHIEVTGGTFEAAIGSSCIYIDKNAPAKLTVNIKSGSFKTTDIETPATTSDGMIIPGEMIITKVPAFVNESPLAILVVDPTVMVDASILMSNAGIGAHPVH